VGYDAGYAEGRLRALADLNCARGVQLVYVDLLELQDETQPVVRVPAERERGDLLLAAMDAAGEALRNAGNDVAVEIDRAVASCNFPGADAAIPDAEWMIDFGPRPGSPLGIVGAGSPVKTQLPST
jgi:hypothetical protein